MLQSEVRKALSKMDSNMSCPWAFVAGWVESAGLVASDEEIQGMLATMTNGLPDVNDIPLDDMAEWLAGTATGIQMF